MWNTSIQIFLISLIFSLRNSTRNKNIPAFQKFQQNRLPHCLYAAKHDLIVGDSRHNFSNPVIFSQHTTVKSTIRDINETRVHYCKWDIRNNTQHCVVPDLIYILHIFSSRPQSHEWESAPRFHECQHANDF